MPLERHTISSVSEVSDCQLAAIRELLIKKYTPEKYIDFFNGILPNTTEIAYSGNEEQLASTAVINVDRIIAIAGISKDAVVSLMQTLLTKDRVQARAQKEDWRLWVSADSQAVKMLMTLGDRRLAGRFIYDPETIKRMYQGINGIQDVSINQFLDYQKEITTLDEPSLRALRRLNWDRPFEEVLSTRRDGQHHSDSDYHQIIIAY